MCLRMRARTARNVRRPRGSQGSWCVVCVMCDVYARITDGVDDDVRTAAAGRVSYRIVTAGVARSVALPAVGPPRSRIGISPRQSDRPLLSLRS